MGADHRILAGLPMKKYKNVSVTESQLEDLIRQGPELIEDGLRFVDHQVSTGRGPLDVLFVDSGGALVVAELKVIEDDGMLVQAIDYYDFVYRNLDSFVRAYEGHQIKSDQEPGLFLIAPSFSATLLNRIKWIKIPVSLFTVQCIELEDDVGEILPIYTYVATPVEGARVEAYSIDDRFDYITDEDVRGLGKQLITQVIALEPGQVSAEAIQTDISIKYRGRVLGYLAPRRNFFHIYTYDAERNWIPHKVDDEVGLEAAMEILEANLSKMSSATSA